MVKTPNGPAYSKDNGETFTRLGAGTCVSMNFWGFTPALFEEIERRFPDFLREVLPENPSAEMLVPNLGAGCSARGFAPSRSCRARDVWHGMTYKEDKPEVVAAIRELIDRGEYPERLWSNFPGYIA